MAVHGIDAQADDLDPALVELGLDPCHVAEFGGADGREVLGMREQHGPGIADPVVKADAALGRIGLEVGCGFAKLECHIYVSIFARGARALLSPSHISGMRGQVSQSIGPKKHHTLDEASLSAAMAVHCVRCRRTTSDAGCASPAKVGQVAS